MKKILILIFIYLPLVFLFANEKKEISIENAKIRAVPPSSLNTGGFMIIKNNSKEDIKLIKAESDISESVELHTVTMVDKTMKMRPVDSIEIKKNDSIELKPGSFHIMFIGLKAPLKKDEKKVITLFFSNGKKETLTVPVVEMNK